MYWYQTVWQHNTSKSIITHFQWEAYMDLVENVGGGGRQEIEEPQGMK